MQMKLMQTKQKMMMPTLYHKPRTSKQTILMLMPKMMKKLRLTTMLKMMKRLVIKMQTMPMMPIKRRRQRKPTKKKLMVIKRMKMRQLLIKLMRKRLLKNQSLQRLHLQKHLPQKLQVPRSTVKQALRKHKMEETLQMVMSNNQTQLELRITIKMKIETFSSTNKWTLDQIYWTYIQTYIINRLK